ncbi:hypothetical protein [Streptomyces purpurascens]|uniref:hypothetical protein n=1 Tax=Streptomyces purpurascens TaxID=1924 RepID=UPI001678E08E|nr:hypothetical protein [Streptomyces purpurascens]MCE7052933.1 hypothetical protein [Streptomyces purpurascens]GHA17858.1 hypothetical protein GCM10010303_29910 [Streptomyces purpurascens]
MPAFETPEPDSVTLRIGTGLVRFHAGDRTDTVAEVLPTDPERDADVRLAEQTQVSCAGGRPHIEAPR